MLHISRQIDLRAAGTIAAAALLIGAALTGCNVSQELNNTPAERNTPSQSTPSTTAELPGGEVADALPEGRRNRQGFRDVGPGEILQHLHRFHLVDVREAYELQGPLGQIEGVHHIPLGSLPHRLNELPESDPVLIVCRSGNRSAQACAWLSQQHGRECWNLSGGMIGWNRQAASR